MALVAKESTDTSTVSSRANQTKEEQGVTYDMDMDNISSDNVKTYVVSSLDNNSITSNIVSSNKTTTNSYCTLPDNKINNVDDRKYNLFTNSQVNNFLKPKTYSIAHKLIIKISYNMNQQMMIPSPQPCQGVQII